MGAPTVVIYKPLSFVREFNLLTATTGAPVTRINIIGGLTTNEHRLSKLVDGHDLVFTDQVLTPVVA